ncbi:family 16 glycosylhydrolase [Robertkochia sediminum]|uniref:family 16 glycosylhydrolase n=1 Tax=Robertkochia sediminum TaxID=2785326 RepID=UPI00193383CA|nr:family 16 glycosylhydrolase [Robertkochia sediminum]MBL7473980.1 family 16 glycosylhydrolase [Robertkochia sediminum]
MKNLFRSISFLGVMTLFIVSCSGDSDSDVTNPIPDNNTSPSNLQIETHIVGSNASPAGNGSGTVNFEATADNALDYRFIFNNTVKESTEGKATFNFGASGTFTVTVEALGEGNTTVSENVTFEIFVDPSLVWAQEFEEDGSLDTDFWNYEIGDGCDRGICGWGNNEKQWYTDSSDNVTVENDVLRITARAESDQDYDYSSARITTQNKFSFQYGRVEVRAKLPEGGGTWPAIWMLGANINEVGWPKCGEIDIMEHVGNNPGRVSAATHDEFFYSSSARYNATNVDNVSTEFHVYSLEWDQNGMNFFVDDKLFFNSPNDNTLPYNQDFFLILNIAMGGNLGGDIDPAFQSGSMEIDYIRVFQ